MKTEDESGIRSGLKIQQRFTLPGSKIKLKLNQQTPNQKLTTWRSIGKQKRNMEERHRTEIEQEQEVKVKKEGEQNM